MEFLDTIKSYFIGGRNAMFVTSSESHCCFVNIIHTIYFYIILILCVLNGKKVIFIRPSDSPCPITLICRNI